ncbi:hypothetical protein [Brevundimonas sp. FT23028]|uniref:hypothetical protein n=1 Tax=Brevundimonas sp. FT23028 TaxID=3393748 RepID=UPI003B5866AB
MRIIPLIAVATTALSLAACGAAETEAPAHSSDAEAASEASLEAATVSTEQAAADARAAADSAATTVMAQQAGAEAAAPSETAAPAPAEEHHEDAGH